MFKADEMKVLDKAIKALGPHSYLGPWLTENRASILADITNDVPVSCMLPGEARRVAEDMIKNAKAEAEQIRASAQQVASAREKAATENCEHLVRQTERLLGDKVRDASRDMAAIVVRAMGDARRV